MLSIVPAACIPSMLQFFPGVVVQSLSCVRLFVTSWTAARQASLSHHLPTRIQLLLEPHRGLVYSPTCVLSRFSCAQLFATPWTLAHQVPLSMGFSRQESWNALPFPPPGDLPDPGIEPKSPASPAQAGRFFTSGPLGKAV